MRISVFTSNQPRHIALLDALYTIGHEVLAVIEPKTMLIQDSPVMREYWQRVRGAEAKVFPMPAPYVTVPAIVLRPGELSHVPLPPDVLDADQFIVFSASYIRGPLCTKLIAANALNLHVGIAPEFRGSAPNFWAEYLRQPDLVGAQVQRLARGLDAGEILAEVRPPLGGDPFLRGMEACRLGIEALVAQIMIPVETWTPIRPNDRSAEIAYQRHEDFTPHVVRTYLETLARE